MRRAENRGLKVFAHAVGKQQAGGRPSNADAFEGIAGVP